MENRKKKQEKKFNSKFKNLTRYTNLGNINGNFEGEYLRINPYA
jgi:hypothetical protein